jgi:hypothetical protein
MIPLVILGSISGAVVFDGTPPARKEIERDIDPVCAKTKEETRDVIVANGKLRDVLVHVVKGAKPDAAPAGPVVVAQHDCEYEPRVSAIVVGQKLAIHNGDPTYHNVHGSLVGGKNLWNESQPAGDPDLVKDTPATVGAVVSLHCDVHAWMQAYAVVVDNAHFAITGDDGTFTLPDLPPGTYTIEAWHPTLGTRTATIKIGTGKRADQKTTFHFKAVAAKPE